MYDFLNLNIISLKKCNGFGNKTIINLLNEFSLNFSQDKLNFNQIKNHLNENQKRSFLESYEKNYLVSQKILEICKKQKILITNYVNDDFPKILKQISDCPCILFYYGDLGNLNISNSIAIVGTRKFTSYGKSQAQRYSKSFVLAGLNIVSGLASGIDTLVHQEALIHKGICIGILGTPINKIYPSSNLNLAKKILSNNGLIISEYEPGAIIRPENFPQRNRIIAGLSKATLVIEAAQKSGSLITAKLAFDYNREVFSIPADVTRINSQGCNELIRDGIAKLTFDPNDILEELISYSIPKDSNTNLLSNYTGDYKKILELLILNPLDSDELSGLSNIEINLLNSLITELEIDGVIQKSSEGKINLIQ